MQQSSGDSSLWRSLAVAFGDGLAFGVGMKLSQAAKRQGAAPLESGPSRTDASRLAERVEQLERSLKRLERAPSANTSSVDQKILEAIVAALEARLAEHAGQVDRRLADLDAKLAIEDRAVSQRISDEITALQGQLVNLHREFGEEVARIVAEQVDIQVQAQVPRAAEAAVDARLQATVAVLDRSMSARIAAAVEAAVEPRLVSARRELQDGLAAKAAEQVASQAHAAVAASVPAAVRAGLQPFEQQLRAEVARKDREIAELRQKLSDTDSHVLGLISGIGQMCAQAVEKLAPKAVEEDAPPVEEEGQAQKAKGLWRVPLVSSILIASGTVVARHFL